MATLIYSAKIRKNMKTGRTHKSERLNALAKVNNKGNGYMNELIPEIGQKFVDEFIAVGFIICGYTLTAKTWRVSELGKEFYAEIK